MLRRIGKRETDIVGSWEMEARSNGGKRRVEDDIVRIKECERLEGAGKETLKKSGDFQIVGGEEVLTKSAFGHRKLSTGKGEDSSLANLNIHQEPHHDFFSPCTYKCKSARYLHFVLMMLSCTIL